jgi:hypothetical protein
VNGDDTQAFGVSGCFIGNTQGSEFARVASIPINKLECPHWPCGTGNASPAFEYGSGGVGRGAVDARRGTWAAWGFEDDPSCNKF